MDHTPGPWRIDGFCRCVARDEVVVEVFGQNRTANADLIAAAPELLEACKALLDGGPDCGCEAEGHICGWPKVKQQAEVAIAKAEGKVKV